MTSVPVTDIGLQPMSYMNEAGNTKSADGLGFMNALQSAMSGQEFLTTPGIDAKASVQQIETPKNSVNSEANKEVNTSKTEKVEKTSTDKNTKEAKKSESEGKKADVSGKKADANDNQDEMVTEENVSPEVVETIASAIGEVITEISEVMDVPEEVVVQSIEEIGMTKTQLLEPAELPDLVAKISGNEDAMSLLTDETLYQNLETLQTYVSDTAENLMEELDLSQEALSEVLEQTEALIEQPIAEETESLIEVAEDDEPSVTGMKDFKVTVTENGESFTVDVTVDEATGSQSAVFTQNGNAESDAEDSSNEKGMDFGKKEDKVDRNSSEKDTVQNQTSIFTQDIQINNDEISTEPATDQISYLTPDTQRIADQILDNIKMNLKPEMTELEMNLHPASLGNVRVNLSAQGGQVTAQFMAQNEAVKSVIESQVAQLTQQLESQGIKIEAVEVTLASHQFENNTSQNGANENNSANEQNKPKVAKIRKLDLASLEDEDLEALDESDRIAADMMAQNGNTVDYMA